MLEHLTNANGKWAALKEDWRRQCESLGEDFEFFARVQIETVSDFAEISDLTGARPAGIFGFSNASGGFDAFCKLSCSPIPGFDGPVLRTRMIAISPEFDIGERTIEEYIFLTSELFKGVFHVSKNEMPSDHIKFHLRSPADRRFFAMLGSKLDGTGVFQKVEHKGSWLHITK